MRKRDADRSQADIFGAPPESEPVTTSMDPAWAAPGGEITAKFAVVAGRAIDLTGPPALCMVCGKHWLSGPKRTCYWCQKDRVDADASAT